MTWEVAPGLRLSCLQQCEAKAARGRYHSFEITSTKYVPHFSVSARNFPQFGLEHVREAAFHVTEEQTADQERAPAKGK